MRTISLLASCLCVSLEAQTLNPEATAASVSVPPNTTKTQLSIALPAQKVGPGDLIALAVADCPELTRSFRVAADGTLPLPLLKERIHAAGKQPDQIGTEISEALISEEILVRPAVSASVVEYQSVPVSVLGAVRRPVTFQAVGTIKLLDALTRAEGLTPEAGPEILLTRTRTPNGEPTVQHIAVKALIDNADPNLNVRLLGGEEIRVPVAGRVYVVGNVKKSGTISLTDGNDFTVLKAISLSEGLMPFTNKQAFIYRRPDGGNTRQEILIELSKIIARKSPDVSLKPNDVLYIPDSKGRRLTAQTLERIASFGSATATGILVWH